MQCRAQAPYPHRARRWNRYQAALGALTTLALVTACSRGALPGAPTSSPRARALDPVPILVETTRARPRHRVTHDYAALAKTLEAHLYRDIVDRWYPLAVDETRGGFGPHFKADWSPSSTDNRFLVFQARMTWVAASVALRSPERRERFKGYALHGLDWLERGQWDARAGGFYWDVGADGTPLTTEKHAYGLAFGIFAAASVARATGDERAKALALRAFDWLDDNAHDSAHGGYFEALDRTGKPILSPPTSERATDQIGTPYGKKSMNAHLHLLEALSALYEVAPERRVRTRLEEVFAIVRDRIVDPRGFANLYFLPDFTPAGDRDSYGHDVETAYLLLEAAGTLGIPADPETRRVARLLVDHALRFGWHDGVGGFFEQGRAEAPADRTEKIWWTQAEGMNALLLMHELHRAESEAYFAAFRAEWAFIERFLLDRKHGEWFEAVSANGELLRADADKGGQWKDPYHQGRALMNAIERLERLGRLERPAESD
jgi:mannobiose 2-epimerase